MEKKKKKKGSKLAGVLFVFLLLAVAVIVTLYVDDSIPKTINMTDKEKQELTAQLQRQYERDCEKKIQELNLSKQLRECKAEKDRCFNIMNNQYRTLQQLKDELAELNTKCSR